MSEKTERMIKLAFMITGTICFIFISVTVLQVGSAMAEFGEAMSSFP